MPQNQSRFHTISLVATPSDLLPARKKSFWLYCPFATPQLSQDNALKREEIPNYLNMQMFGVRFQDSIILLDLFYANYFSINTE